eukprot:7085830-Prymnesium_polylepis.2
MRAALHLQLARKRHAQQEEADRAERRFHPVPCPGADLEHRIRFAVRRVVRRDKVMIEGARDGERENERER